MPAERGRASASRGESGVAGLGGGGGVGPRREFRAAARGFGPAPSALPPPLLAPSPRPRATLRGGSAASSGGASGRCHGVLSLSLSSPPRAWSRGFPEEELRGTGRGSGSVGAAGSRPSLLPPSLPLSSRSLSARAEDRLLVNPGRDGWPRLLGWLRETRGAWQKMSPVLLSPLGYFESS